MSIRISDQNNIKDVLKALEDLQRYHVEIGIFSDEGSHLLMIAAVHEYGTTIEPKNGRHLTIPFPAAGDRTAREFGPELFRPKGTNILAVEKGKGNFEPMFALVDKVEIPERSFLRSGFDENQDKLGSNMENMLQAVLELRITPENLYERVGAWLVSRIQKKIREISSPGNAPATRANKGSSNPLIDTGRLRQSITWRVVKG